MRDISDLPDVGPGKIGPYVDQDAKELVSHLQDTWTRDNWRVSEIFLYHCGPFNITVLLYSGLTTIIAFYLSWSRTEITYFIRAASEVTHDADATDAVCANYFQLCKYFSLFFLHVFVSLARFCILLQVLTHFVS